VILDPQGRPGLKVHRDQKVLWVNKVSLVLKAKLVQLARLVDRVLQVLKVKREM
jgi:hypothetical protein